MVQSALFLISFVLCTLFNQPLVAEIGGEIQQNPVPPSEPVPEVEPLPSLEEAAEEKVEGKSEVAESKNKDEFEVSLKDLNQHYYLTVVFSMSVESRATERNFSHNSFFKGQTSRSGNDLVALLDGVCADIGRNSYELESVTAADEEGRQFEVKKFINLDVKCPKKGKRVLAKDAAVVLSPLPVDKAQKGNHSWPPGAPGEFYQQQWEAYRGYEAARDAAFRDSGFAPRGPLHWGPPAVAPWGP